MGQSTLRISNGFYSIGFNRVGGVTETPQPFREREGGTPSPPKECAQILNSYVSV